MNRTAAPRSSAKRICDLMFSTMLGALAFLAARPARAEVVIGGGDVIEITVATLPELQRRMPVQPDGSISFPMIGSVTVAGLTPAALQTRIQTLLATKIFRQRTSDGGERAIPIDPAEVTATVAQYRPVYVNGDVFKPGEQTFRPAMTARQAIALAGGYDLLRARTDNYTLLAADLRGEHASLWEELAKEQVRLWRLKSELAGSDGVDPNLLADAPLPQSMKAEILRLEAEQLKSNRLDAKREEEFLRNAAKQSAAQVKTLAMQEQKEEEGVKADTEELAKITELVSKGTLTNARLADSRRALLLSSTRKLQTTAQLMQTKRQQDELERQLERFSEQRRARLLQEAQDAGFNINRLHARIQSASDKLRYTTGRRTSPPPGDVSAPDIVLVRKSASGWERIAASEDSDVLPGDVIEVALRSKERTDEPNQ